MPLFLGEWHGQHGFYMEENNLDYRVYYNDPDEMMRVQLESAKRKRELPWCDTELGVVPEGWGISVDFWPVVAPGAFGCELMCRLFETVRKCFGLTSLHMLTYPEVDIERVRGIMGDEVWLSCIIDGGILSFGTEQQIIDAVKGIMKAKGRGRLGMLVGDMIWGVPAKNYEAYYEAVKAYGKY